MLSVLTKRKPDTAEPTTASTGLWQLAMRRLKRDRIAMFSLLIVLFYLVLLILSSTGLIAKDWNKEVAVSYAPPTFIGAAAIPATQSETQKVEAAVPENPVDPLKDVIRELNAEIAAEQGVGGAIDYYGVVDPLAEDMKAIDQALDGHLLDQQAELKQSLILGADKWGQSVLLKTIKGAETSIIVGLVAAFLAVVIGTVLGAISGYFGGWIDDVLNWFYNIFTSIPYLLLVLAIAAVLQQKRRLIHCFDFGFNGVDGSISFNSCRIYEAYFAGICAGGKSDWSES